MVREEDAGGVGVRDLGGVPCHHVQELDQVELVHEGVGHLDEDFREPLGEIGRASCRERVL